MSQEITVVPQGLNTNTNEFAADLGSFNVLRNAIVSKPGVLQPRPGVFGDVLRTDPTNPATDVTSSDNTSNTHFLTAHFTDSPNQPYFISNQDGRFGYVDINSDPEAYKYFSFATVFPYDKRLRSIKIGDNMYFTGKDSIKRLEGPDFKNGGTYNYLPKMVNAGLSPMFLSSISNSSGLSVGTACPTDAQVAYRAILKSEDNSELLHIGTPSNRSVYVNQAYDFDASGELGIITCTLPTGSIDDAFNISVGDAIEIRKAEAPPGVKPDDYVVLTVAADSRSFTFDCGTVEVTFDMSEGAPYRIGKSAKDLDIKVIMPFDYPHNSSFKLYRSKTVGDSDTTPSEDMGECYESNPIPRYTDHTCNIGADRTLLQVTASAELEYQVGDIIYIFQNTVSGSAGYVREGAGIVETLVSNGLYNTKMTVRSLYQVDDNVAINWGLANSGPYSFTPSILRERTVTDTISDELLGELIYTSPQVEGPQAANDQPPAASCIEQFNGSMFLGNTCTRDFINLQLEAAPILDDAFKFIIIEMTGTNMPAITYQIWQHDLPSDIYVKQDGSPQGIPKQIEMFCNVLLTRINLHNKYIRGFYVSSADVTNPGQMVLESYEIDSAGGESFSMVITFYDHGTATEVATIPPTWNAPWGIVGAYPVRIYSKRDKFEDGLYYSKTNEPEAVPALNYFRIGQQGKRILNMKSLQNALLIFKEDGVYKLIGGDPSSFSVEALDQSLVLVAPDSIARFENQVIGFFELGVAEVSEQAGSYFSQKIDDKLRYCLQNFDRSAIEEFSWGMLDVASRRYTLRVANQVGHADQGLNFSPIMLNFDMLTKAWTMTEEISVAAQKFEAAVYDNIIDRPVYIVSNDSVYFLMMRADFNADVNRNSIAVVESSTTGSGYTYVVWSGLSTYGSTLFPAGTGLLYQVGNITSASGTIQPTAVLNNGNIVGEFDLTPGTQFNVPWYYTTGYGWTGKFGQNPGQTKRFRESSITFGELYYVANIDVVNRASNNVRETKTTDISLCYSYPDTAYAKSIVPFRIGVPRQISRSTIFGLEVNLPIMGQKFDVLAFGTVYEDISTRVGKK